MPSCAYNPKPTQGMFPSAPICDSVVDHGGIRRVNESVTRDARLSLLNEVRSEWARQQLQAINNNNNHGGEPDSDPDSDWEPPTEPEVVVVTKSKIQEPKKRKASKLRKQLLKRKARSANTNKGLLCCRATTRGTPGSSQTATISPGSPPSTTSSRLRMTHIF